MIVPAPIPSVVVERALEALAADPESNEIDRKTLERGYFHASLDSKNAHSAICRSIVREGFAATFSSKRWHFDQKQSETHSGHRLHRLAAMLSIEAILQDDYDVIHVVVARRLGSFEDHEIARWPAYCREVQFGSTIRESFLTLPGRYPLITAAPAGADEPGIQVCDFILWATQRARPEGLTLRGKRDWVDRLGLRPSSGGGMVNGPLRDFDGELGHGARRRSGMVGMYKGEPPPRSPQELSDGQRFELLMEMASDVRHAAKIAAGHQRIGHLTNELAAGLRGPAALGTEGLREALNALATAFLLVCDTLPVYDVADPQGCSRATEKRALAAAFLGGRVRLWLPEGASPWR
ncbi:hypothetical protein [Labilithrix luteola]|uniref:hypothetical protein n=1 Tax=Labilithrix luteola TaxID=1391654 RepID=UPI0011BA4DAA|nr:hypothetical protein [Labilithrix luteola]